MEELFQQILPERGATVADMTSNRIPRQITDKNGVLTTRWVKDSQSAGTAAAIPMPHIVTERSDTYQRSLYEAAAALVNETASTSIDERMDELSSLSEDTLKKITDAEPWKLWTVKEIMEDGRGEDFLRDYFSIADVLADNDISDTDDAISYVRSLDLHEGLVERDGSLEVSVVREKQTEALMNITLRLHGMVEDWEMDGTERLRDIDYSGFAVPLLIDPKLTKLIYERPEDAERIVKIMNERSAVDADTITAVLDHSTPALAEGVL